MTNYDLDAPLANVTERLRKLEQSVARTRPAGGVTYTDTDGDFGTPGEILSLEEILALIGSGAAGGLGSITDGITTVAPVTSLTVEPHSLSGTTPNASHAIERLVTVAASGSAYEFDLANGNRFDITLDDDPDLTIAAGAVSGYPESIVVFLRQPDPIGGGPYVVNSWDAAIVWQAADGTPTGSPPTLFTAAGAVDTIVLTSFDGGTTWGGFHGSGGGATAIEILDDGVSLTGTPTSMDFVGAGVTATAVGDDVTVTIAGPTTHYEPVQFDDGSAEWPFVYFGGEIVMAEVPN